MEERHVSLVTVARTLGVSERTVRRWIKSGKLRAYRPGRDFRIPESAVRELMEESEVYPKVQAPLWLEEESEQRRESRRRDDEWWGMMIKQILGTEVDETDLTDPYAQRAAFAEILQKIMDENERLRASVAELREELKAKETV